MLLRTSSRVVQVTAMLSELLILVGRWSVVIPLHLKHYLIHRRRQVAVLALGAQAQAEVARQFPLLVQADAAPYFAIGEEISLGFQAQVAQRVFHSTPVLKPRRGRWLR